MRVNSFSSCIQSVRTHKKMPVVWTEGKFAYQKLPIIKAHSGHILHCIDVCGLIGDSGSADRAGNNRTGTPTRSLRLKGGPARHAFSTS